MIEPIWKSIHNTLYFNSKHAPKCLEEAMQKAQDLHIKHLYAVGEDQQDPLPINPDGLPEITVNEMNTQDNKGWYRNRRKDSQYSQNSWERSMPTGYYNKKVMFDQSYDTRAVLNSESSDHSSDLWTLSTLSQEVDKDKPLQQPNLIRGS